MSQDALKTILLSADALSRPVFGADDVAGWPQSTFEALVDGGVLRQTEDASFVTCYDCDEQCDEEVIYINRGDCGPADAYIVCRQREDIRRVPVPLERLRQWAVDLAALAANLAHEIRTIGRVEEIAAGRCWVLGRTTFPAGQVDVFLARDAGTADGVQAISSTPRFQQCSRGLVLTLCDTRSDLFPQKITLSLLRLLSLRDGGLWLDLEAIEGEVGRGAGGSVRRMKKFPTPPGTTWEQVTIAITCGGDGAQLSAGGVSEPRELHEMGLTDARRRQSTPSELWRLLLVLAKEEILTEDSPHYSRAVPKRIERLRKVLRELFGIPGSPFEPYHAANDYRADGYKPRFALYRITYRDE